MRFFDFFRPKVLRSKTKRWTEKCKTCKEINVRRSVKQRSHRRQFVNLRIARSVLQGVALGAVVSDTKVKHHSQVVPDPYLLSPLSTSESSVSCKQSSSVALF